MLGQVALASEFRSWSVGAGIDVGDDAAPQFLAMGWHYHSRRQNWLDQF
jgi:hypothetical protein